MITNLQIAHLELRTDESPDVTPYVSKRSLETVVVPLSDKLQEVREKYIKVLTLRDFNFRVIQVVNVLDTGKIHTCSGTAQSSAWKLQHVD